MFPGETAMTGPDRLLSGNLRQSVEVALAAETGLHPPPEQTRHAPISHRRATTGEGWRASDLQGVVVSRGPGSYTGLRVGLMSAKALAYATGCALLAIDTFAAIAWQAPPEARYLDVLADAQQEKVYLQRFQREGASGIPRSVSSLSIQPFAAFLEGHEAEAWATGPGLREKEERLPEGWQLVSADQWDPRRRACSPWRPRWQKGEQDDFWSVEPLYLRPSAAEEQWRKK